MADDWSLLEERLPKPPQAVVNGVAADPPEGDWSALERALPAVPPQAGSFENPIPTVGPSLLNPVDMVTGGSRTEFPDAPELTPADIRRAEGQSPLAFFTNPQYRQVVIGYLTAGSPEAQRDILKSALQLPAEAFSQDRFGNWMVQRGDQRYYINKPGFSSVDGLQLGRDAMLAGLTRGRSLGFEGAAGVGARVGTGAAANAGASVAYDGIAGLAGSRQGVDGLRSALSGVFGGAAEGLVGPVSGLARRLSADGASALRVAQWFDRDTQSLTETGRAALTSAGINPADYTPEQLTRIVQIAMLAGRSPASDIVARAGAAVRSEESLIPRTRGQAANDPAMLRREQELRLRGGRPADLLAMFERRQAEAANAAVERTRVDILRNSTNTLDLSQPRGFNELGDMVGDRLRAMADESERAVRQAYSSIPDLNGVTFEAGSAAAFRNRIGEIARDIPVGERTTAERLLREAAEIGGDAPPTLAQITQLRTRLGNAVSRNADAPEDVALIRAKEALDAWVDGAVSSGLVTGDDGAIAALRNARALQYQHTVNFERPRRSLHPGVPAGALPRGETSPDISPAVRRSINRVLHEGASGSEVADAVFGRGVDFSGTGLRQTVEHVYNLLGHDVAADALRETAINRLLLGAKVTDQPGLAKVADRIEEAVRGRGEGAMGVLFDADEIARLSRLAAELRDVSRMSADQARTQGNDRLMAALKLGGGGGAIGGFIANALGFPWLAGTATVGAVGALAPMVRDTGAAMRAVSGGAMRPEPDLVNLLRTRALSNMAQQVVRTAPQPAARGGLLFRDDEDR